MKHRTNPLADKWIFLFNKVEGIMSHVIYVLICLDWDPRQLEVWISPTKQTWVLESFKPVALTNLIQQVSESIHQQEQARASVHFLAPPANTPIVWHHTLAQVRKYKKLRLNSEMAIVESVIAASMWPAERINDIHPNFPKLCPRCHKYVESTKHTLYECTENAKIDHPYLIKRRTQATVAKAVKYFETNPSFWGRTIINKNMLTLPKFHDPLDDYPIHMGTNTPMNPKPGEWPSGDYFGDGSGGKNSSTPEIRRCGYGGVYIDEEHVGFDNSLNLDDTILGIARWPALFTFWSKLPGNIQTVPRAELKALLTVVENVELNGIITYHIDNKMVHDTYHKGKKRALLSANSDMFNDLFKSLKSRNITLTLRWMPSHTDEFPLKPKPQWVTDFHTAGNTLADHQATIAAEAHQLPFALVEPILTNLKDLKIIQKRAVIIYQSLPDRVKPFKEARHKIKLHLEDHLRATDHHIILNPKGTRYICQACNQNISKNASHLPDFLDTACIPATCNFGYSVAIGNLHTHISHNLALYGGMYICLACGSTGREKINKDGLGAPCKKLPTFAGKQNIRRYLQGKPLLNLGWPFHNDPATAPTLKYNRLNSITNDMDQAEAKTIIQLASNLSHIAETQSNLLQNERDNELCQSPIASPRFRPSVPIHTQDQLGNVILAQPLGPSPPLIQYAQSVIEIDDGESQLSESLIFGFLGDALDTPQLSTPMSSTDARGSAHSRPNTMDFSDVQIDESQPSQTFACPPTPIFSDSDGD